MEDNILNLDYKEKNQIENLRALLKEKDIRISHQRILILDYLVNHDTHPSADEIFQDLKSIDPIISQATVYNTLNLFVERKLVKELDFNMASKRYEFINKAHGHFICENCKSIIDFDLLDSPQIAGLADYKIENIEIIYRGVCPRCMKKNLG
mgnify:CR=1 FL=1